MPGPVWNVDARGDIGRIQANAAALIADLAATAQARVLPDESTPRDWHRRLYADCAVPIDKYVGHYRGDPAVPELIDYEVGIGPGLADRLPEKVGVWSDRLGAELPVLMGRIHAGLRQLDLAFEPGVRPASADGVQAIVQLAAAVHGEWVRLHPFANGNGRTARVWANFVALRYALPAFVAVKPRPEDVSYARAGRDSMGRPPHFVGDHAATGAVFLRLLQLESGA